MPLIRGSFSLKVLNYRYQCLKSVRNYGHHLKKSAELWAPFWKNVEKYLLIIEKCSLPCGNMGMVFIIFLDLWVAFCSNTGGIMGGDFESK